jgi:hypothetical protein
MINYAKRRRIIIAAIAVAILIFGSIIFTLIKNAVTENSKQKAPDLARISLLSVSDDSAVVMNARGEIVGNEEYDSYSITIAPSYRAVVIMKGYNQDIVKRYDYSNNKNAYEQFVYSLDKLDITDSKNLSEAENDTRGVCAKGTLTSYSIIKSSSVVKNVWTSTCRDSRGSIKSNSSDIESLFMSQLPQESKYALPRL